MARLCMWVEQPQAIATNSVGMELKVLGTGTPYVCVHELKQQATPMHDPGQLGEVLLI